MATQLSHLDKDQVTQLVTRAKHLRERSKGKREETLTPLDTWIERILRKDQREFAASKRLATGTVVAVTSQTCTVECEGETIWARLLSHTVVVGDVATVGQGPSEDWGVVALEARRTKLSRPDVHEATRERVIVANIDIIVIVVSVVSPPFHPRLIDRYLVAIEQGGAKPVVCVNKIDLLTDPHELDALQPYRELGLTVVTCSALNVGSESELREAIRGKTCAFVGHSGVGKSSLVNSLKPEANLRVGAVSEVYGRGTHTTTASSLHRLEDGTILIDTPGIRSFGMRDLTKVDVSSYFPEFAGIQCKFKNCKHETEPECGILAAVEKGAISPARFESYRRLMADAPN